MHLKSFCYYHVITKNNIFASQMIATFSSQENKFLFGYTTLYNKNVNSYSTPRNANKSSSYRILYRARINRTQTRFVRNFNIDSIV